MFKNMRMKKLDDTTELAKEINERFNIGKINLINMRQKLINF